MWFRYLLDCLSTRPNSKRSRPANRRSRTLSLAVEPLEIRWTPAAMLSIGDVTIVEGNAGTETALVPVRLSAKHSNTITVNYNTADGSAAASSDFGAVTGSLTFARGEQTKYIPIPVIGDRVVEADEYFSVNLFNPKGSRVADGTGQVTIADDEPYVYTSDAYAMEENEGTLPTDFTVFMNRPYDVPVTINYATADGSAVAGLDYTATAGTLTFAPGETSQPFPVMVLGDRLGEPDESFVVNISTPNSYARIADSVGLATIADNEPSIIISDSYLSGTTFTFSVTSYLPYDEVVTVNFTTMDGTASSGVDYVAASGTLTFDRGETSKTITIDVLDPSAVSDKYFIVQLSSATTNASIRTSSAYGYWYYYDGGYYDCGCYGYAYDYGGYWY